MKKIFTYYVALPAIFFFLSCKKNDIKDKIVSESSSINYSANSNLTDSVQTATLPPKPLPRITGEESQSGYLFNCTESTIDWYQQTYIRYDDGSTSDQSPWQYTGTTFVSLTCENIPLGSGGGGGTGGGSPGMISPMPREESTGGPSTPASAPAHEVSDLSTLYGFGGPQGDADKGRLSCASFKFAKLSSTANSQEAGIRGFRFVINLPNGTTVRNFDFRTMYVNIGVKQADGTIITSGRAAEMAAFAANRAGASLAIKYMTLTTPAQVNALLSFNIEREFKQLFEIILKTQEVGGYGGVNFVPSKPSVIVSDAVWNSPITKIHNWFWGAGCDN